MTSSNGKNGNGGNGRNGYDNAALFRLLLPILISLIVGGATITQGNSRAAGITERQLQVATTLERQQQIVEDLSRRVEDLEISSSDAIRLAHDNISQLSREIALQQQQHSNLLLSWDRDSRLFTNKLNELGRQETSSEDAIDDIEDRVTILEYWYERHKMISEGAGMRGPE